MNIGEAAAASGVSAKMIRHYETLGLVPAVGRTEAGYRQYGERELHTLRFIGRARDLGFSIDEIRELLSLWQDRGRPSAKVRALAQDHLKALEKKVQELVAMIVTLRHLVACCSGDHRPDCPILEELGRTAPHSAAGVCKGGVRVGTH